jgi:oligopeptide transport system permease protein
MSAGSLSEAQQLGDVFAGSLESSTVDAIESRSPLRMSLSTFLDNHAAVVAAGTLVVITLFSFVGPLIYRTNQVSANLLLENQAPSLAHLLGMNPNGQDELGSLMVGGQSTLEVGLAVGILSTSFGLVWGIFAGYVGGVVDAILMRTVDALLAIPFLFFVVLLSTLVTPTLPLIILVITAVSWLSTARLVRGETLTLRTRDYVTAARGFGSGAPRVMRRHITPNLLGVVVVNGTFRVADAILIFVALSYLGLGVPPPATNWGDILNVGISNLFDGYWWQLWPAAILIVATVLAISVLGDALSDIVEIRLQKR